LATVMNIDAEYLSLVGVVFFNRAMVSIKRAMTPFLAFGFGLILFGLPVAVMALSGRGS